MQSGVIKINISDSKNSKITGTHAGNASERRLDLNPTAREILLKACRMYRARIPIYLQSKQAEIQIVDNIIQKLT